MEHDMKDNGVKIEQQGKASLYIRMAIHVIFK